MDTEKEKMVAALRMGEELRRKTGRTTRVSHEAAVYVIKTREPAVLVGIRKDDAQRMVELAHEKIDGCVGRDNAGQLKALVSGCSHLRRESLRGSPCRVFEDHYVTLERAVEAIEAL